jgi:hypothetical protein
MLRLATAAVAAFLLAAPLTAQVGRTPGAFEFGVDIGVGTDDQSDVTTIAIPVPRLRVGFFASPRLSLEPSVAFTRVSGDGDSFSTLDADVGLLAHLTGTPQTAALYLRPFVGLQRISGDFNGVGSESMTRTRLGGGIGVKLPVLDHRLAWRLEGSFGRLLESDDTLASNQFAFTVGLSFLTR